ncbi:MAG TPA: hypothetical protein VHH72_08035 [Solirubrobacterales bacterium]|nr:hypothetical protein [Solirubrobacterales bacterium]
MGLRESLKRLCTSATGPPVPDGIAELHVGDPRYDDWDIVRDFSELEAARAWRQQLTDTGIEAVLTSDWPLDEWGRGDISLRVPPGSWSEAEHTLGDE